MKPDFQHGLLEVSAADAIDLQRKVDSGDYASLEVKLVARQDGGATNIIFLDHIPPEERAKYAHFIRK